VSAVLAYLLGVLETALPFAVVGLAGGLLVRPYDPLEARVQR